MYKVSNKLSGMFRRGNCHVKIIKTFAHKARGFLFMA